VIDPSQELRIRATLLHRHAAAGQPAALARLRKLPEHRKTSEDALSALAFEIKRKHCLAVIARECGFQSWEHALRVLGGDDDEVDYGDLLYPRGCAVHLNHWFARDEEARAHRQAHGGYLLTYRRQFLVVDRDYIVTLGLDPDDPAWDVLDWDWTHRRGAEARRRLYALLLSQNKPAA
jgi:hypothetical protein